MKKLLFVVAIALFSANLNAQTPYYYYYQGEKLYLSLNTEYIYLSLQEPKMPDDILQRDITYVGLKSDGVDRKEYQNNKGINRYWTTLHLNEKLTEEQYLELLIDIKQKNQKVIIAPYFKSKQFNEMGLSNFFYVKLKQKNDTILLRQIADKNDCIIIQQDHFLPLWFVLSVTETSEINAIELANIFHDSNLFDTAEPDLMVNNLQHFENNTYSSKKIGLQSRDTVTDCANDPYFAYQWNLMNTGQQLFCYDGNDTVGYYNGIAGIDIKACEAWELSTGQNITIAVFDEGISVDSIFHPDLADNIHPYSYDCDTESELQIYQSFHGTGCMGIVGAVRNNSIGMSGVAPESKLMFITSTFTWDPLVSQKLSHGMMKAWQNSADVISCSWSAYESNFLTDAIESAVTQGRDGKGCVVVFGTGNNDELEVFYPAKLSWSFPSVVAVGGITIYGARTSPSTSTPWINPLGYWWGANYGPELNVVAPSDLIPTTLIVDVFPDDPYVTWFFGTSSATPHVAGVAALMLSVNPALTGKQVRDIIESTAQKVREDLYDYDTVPERPNGTWHEEMGHGLVDAYAAVIQSLVTPTCYTEYSELPVVNGTLTHDATWNTPVFANSNITVPSGVTLTINSEVICYSTVSISVQPGGKIIIDGGTFTNACEEEMWQGITVFGDTSQPMQPSYQGYLQMINGTIENTVCGITANGGGIVNTANAHFINNDCGIHLHDGSMLTVSNNSALNFHQKGKLIVEKNGNMTIQDNAQINGILCENDTVIIHVKGGGFTVGNNVLFNNLKGILLENLNTQGQSHYDDYKQYNFRDVTFDNTQLIHSGTQLNISNCTFNPGSHVRTYVSTSNIDSCTFNQTTFKSNDAIKTKVWQHVVVSNCHFIGSHNNEEALQINSARILEIHNNTITGYGIGVNLNSSGATTAYYYGCKTVSAIHHNKISNCITGIELYNSIVNICANEIFNNNVGVKLFNNSSTSLGRLDFPTPNPQIIRDNDSYELYASSSSFPTIFRFNQIIDEDNLGNEFDDPMIYWDLDIRGRFPEQMLRDVKYNCWGNNFNSREDFYPFKFFVYNPIWQCGKSISKTLDADEMLLQTGLDFFADLDFINAEIVFKDIIENHPQSNFAIAAMYELFSLEQFLNNNFYGLHDYFISFSPLDSNLFDVADFLTTRCNVKSKNWQPAVDWYEYRIENPPSYQDSVFAIIDLGAIHLMMEADTLNGAKGRPYCSYRLKDVKPKSKQHFEDTRIKLLATLPQIQKSQTDKPQTTYYDTNKKGSLGQCVPNPTTGNATIIFEIYTEGLAEIKIYNALGQLLQSSSQGKLQQGRHQAKIDVSGMPAGLYHYSLFINGEQTDAKKMIMN